MALYPGSGEDRAELSGAQKPESVLDRGLIGADTRVSQPGVELVSQGSVEEGTAPAETRRGNKQPACKNWEPSVRLSARCPRSQGLPCVARGAVGSVAL